MGDTVVSEPIGKFADRGVLTGDISSGAFSLFERSAVCMFSGGWPGDG
jgi:hypothetical protein